MGNPYSRYGSLNWWRYPDDLFKLDQLCWNLRRLTIALDWVIGDDYELHEWETEHKGKTYKQVFSDFPEFLPRNEISGLDKKVSTELNTRADILCELNFEFGAKSGLEPVAHETKHLGKGRRWQLTVHSTCSGKLSIERILVAN